MKRQLAMRGGTEGPRHDPYSFTEYYLDTDAHSITAHMGLGCWLEVDGVKVIPNDPEDGKLVELAFHILAGFPLDKFEQYYYRIHPYFPDPMGSPRSYE